MAEEAAPKKRPHTPSIEHAAEKPWVAMWSLVIGFFMILLDTTIVTVALPHMQNELNASLSAVIWVTSAYLLAYAVPLLITGRLGDRFGQKQMYLLGMVVFTLSSLWCGLSPNVEMLIVARVVQGIGASLMTPQTMSIITLMFPPHKRGVAMSVWGAAAGEGETVVHGRVPNARASRPCVGAACRTRYDRIPKAIPVKENLLGIRCLCICVQIILKVALGSAAHARIVCNMDARCTLFNQGNLPYFRLRCPFKCYAAKGDIRRRAAREPQHRICAV